MKADEFFIDKMEIRMRVCSHQLATVTLAAGLRVCGVFAQEQGGQCFGGEAFSHADRTGKDQSMGQAILQIRLAKRI